MARCSNAADYVTFFGLQLSLRCRRHALVHNRTYPFEEVHSITFIDSDWLTLSS